MKEKEPSFVEKTMVEFDIVYELIRQRYNVGMTFDVERLKQFTREKIEEAERKGYKEGCTDNRCIISSQDYVEDRIKEAEKRAVERYDSIFERNAVGHYTTTATIRKKALAEFGIKE